MMSHWLASQALQELITLRSAELHVTHFPRISMEYSSIVLVTGGFVLGFSAVLWFTDVLISYAPEDEQE